MKTPPQAITIEKIHQISQQVIAELELAIVGKREVLFKLLAAMLSDAGHILIEDLPGLAKTLIAKSFASVLGLDFKRVQFTPDLLPGDITGGYIFNPQTNKFVLRKGPLFTHILLADEINRASPKTQSALLEAMGEQQVTLEGETFSLPNPYIVIATQNPIEYEGTFPLPEAQLDRFLVKLQIGYPTPEQEQEILIRRRNRKQDLVQLNQVLDPPTMLAMRRQIEDVFIDSDVERYIVALAAKTREHRQTLIGASPRGSLALLKLSRAWAAIQGRDYVLPDDVKCFAVEALSHRIILEPSLWGSKTTPGSVIEEILGRLPVPVLPAEDEQ